MPIHPQIAARNGRFAAGSRARNAGLVPNYGSRTFINAITFLGLTDNLRLCLDAGDSASYGGSGQKWVDRSGNGFDFFVGADVSATATDPTFTGSAGGISSGEYWAHDAGDYFTYDSTNETWMNNLHKAGAQYTIAAWVYLGNATTVQRICGTTAATAANAGVSFDVSVAGVPNVAVRKSGSSQFIVPSSISIPAAAWRFVAVSFSDTLSTCRFRVNSALAFTSGGYTGASTANATNTMQISAGGLASSPLTSGSRLAMFAAWEGLRLSQDQEAALFTSTRARFGV